MHLSLTEYQDKFCRKYTEADHQAMLIQQEEICERFKSSILENNLEITKYFQKLQELNMATQDYNYLLVLSSYAKDILELRQEISELKERINSLNYFIACQECYASDEPCVDDDYKEHNSNELKYLEEKLDLWRNKLVEMKLRFLDENLSVYPHNFPDSALYSTVDAQVQA